MLHNSSLPKFIEDLDIKHRHKRRIQHLVIKQIQETFMSKSIWMTEFYSTTFHTYMSGDNKWFISQGTCLTNPFKHIGDGCNNGNRCNHKVHTITQ